MTETAWIATDLDGTLFSRECVPGAVPATWKPGKPPEPSSWMPPDRHALLSTLAGHFSVVPVTARDLDSFSRVRIDGIPMRAGAVIANGAILLRPGCMTPDPAWDEEMAAQLAPWAEPLAEVASILDERGAGVVRARLVASHTPFAAYLVAKAEHDFWTREAGLVLREAIAHFPGRVAEHGRELQVLPPPVSKAIGVDAFMRRYTNGRVPLLALGDMPEDAPFMDRAAFLAAPTGSRLAKKWHDAN
jgi:hydroxymethylpyrimidine pyrophosphatase-like HAD family hydrolase